MVLDVRESWRPAALLILGMGGCSSPNNPNPIVPDIVFPKYVAVTEGGSTSFELELAPPPAAAEGGILDTADSAVATVMPDHFAVSPTNYPAIMTVLGVDDMIAGPSNRVTTFVGRMAGDDAISGGGTVVVVDRDSLNVLSTNWYVMMQASSTTTFDLYLTKPPSSSTTVAIVLGNDATSTTLVSVSPQALVFGVTNYGMPQTVTLTSDTASGTASIELRPDAGVPPQKVFVSVRQ